MIFLPREKSQNLSNIACTATLLLKLGDNVLNFKCTPYKDWVCSCACLIIIFIHDS